MKTEKLQQIVDRLTQSKKKEEEKLQDSLTKLKQKYEADIRKTKEETEKQLVLTQKRDKIKNTYCEEHGIKLIRIPYWEFKNIEEIFIPKSVKTIGYGVFAGCDALREIIVEKENENYISLNNCLIDKKTNTVIAVCNNAVIPEGVEAIGKMTLFLNTDCASVTIPASVKEIKEHEACNNFMFCGVFSKESGALERPLTLIVEKDSFAEKYAKENNIKYKTVNISMPYPYNLISCIFGERGYGDGVILNADLMMTIESLTLRFSEEEKNVFCMFFIYGSEMASMLFLVVSVVTPVPIIASTAAIQLLEVSMRFQRIASFENSKCHQIFSLKLSQFANSDFINKALSLYDVSFFTPFS